MKRYLMSGFINLKNTSLRWAKFIIAPCLAVIPAVDEAVFAMVSDGELYLRACEQSAKYCKNASSFLTLMKRGRPVLLNYYRVDEGLWQNREKLLQLSSFALDAARKSATSAISVTGLKICRT